MCPPTKSDQPTASSPSETRSFLGLGALMLVACLAAPLVAGAIGSLGLGVLAGAAGVALAVGLCAAVPALALAWRSVRRERS
jgi:hypothetical protein